VYFLENILQRDCNGDSLVGKRVCISGAGNVSLHCAAKLVAGGAVVLTVSDSDGTLLVPAGFTADDVALLKIAKFEKRKRLSTLVTDIGGGAAAGVVFLRGVGSASAHVTFFVLLL
jgi:glutamate dehydrogenase (NADP+)